MKRFSLIFTVFLVPLDFVLVLLAAASAYVLRFSDWAIALKPILFDLSFFEFLSVSVWAAFVWIVVSALLGLYSFDPGKKFLPAVIRVFVGSFLTVACITLYLFFRGEPFDSRFLLATGWALSILFVIVGRLFVRVVRGLCYRMGMGLRRVVIIGDNDATQIIAQFLSAQKRYGFLVLKTFPSFSPACKRYLMKHAIDDVMFTNPRKQEDDAEKAFTFCLAHHITFSYSADLFSSFSQNAHQHPLAGVPMVTLRRSRLQGWRYVMKRVFDVVCSILLIILFSPVMFVTAIAIKLDSKGPVFFSYKRVGKDGELFSYFKFRSMVDGAHAKRYSKAFRKKVKDLRGFTEDNPIIKYENDPRITRVGKFIRRFSIDEFPEFFLVLAGHMSLVGPRPHEQEEVKKYKAMYKRVLSVKPGITGLSQISGRSDLSFSEEVRLDIFYMEHWSLFLDIVILLKTPFILLRRRKAL